MISPRWKDMEKTAYISMIILAGIIITVFFHGGLFQRLFHIEPDLRYNYDLARDGKNRLAKTAKLEGEPVFGNFGLGLAPGKSFRSELRFKKKENTDVILSLNFRSAENIKNSVIVKGGDPEIRYDNMTFTPDQRIFISEELRGKQRFSLILKAANTAEKGKVQPVLQSFNIHLLIDPIPPLEQVGFVWITAAGLYLLLSILGKPGKTSLAISGAAFLVLNATAPLWKFPSFSLVYAAIIVTALSWYFAEKKEGKTDLKPLFILTLGFICVIALGLRLQALDIFKNQDLPPDGITYYKIATQKGGLFETDFREPFHIWVLKIYYLFAPNRPENIRILTIILSLIVLPVSYKFAERISGKTVGLVSALFLASNTPFIRENVRGLRLESLIILLLLFLMFTVFRKSRGKKWLCGILPGIFAGLTCLNTIGLLAPVVIILIYAAARKKIRISGSVVALIITIALIVPHLLHNKKEFGDPFYSSNIHARFYRNMEFGGQKGFPTREEIARDSYTGGKISIREYIFELHDWGDIFANSWRGFTRVLFTRNLRYK